MRVLVVMCVLLSVSLAQTKGDEEETPLRWLPLTDIHAHSMKGGPQEIINLARREKLQRVYIITRSYREHVPLFRANSDIARMLMQPHVGDSGWWASEESFILENRDVVAGVKLHPSGSGFVASLENLSDLFASAQKHGFVVVTHTDGTKRSNAGNFRPLLERYPDTKLVLYHANPLDSAIALMKLYPNVRTDISYTAFNGEWQQRIVAEVGVDRVMFGIDTPLGWPKDSAGVVQSHYRDVVDEIAAWYDHDRAVMKRILHENAVAYFGSWEEP